MSIILVPAVLTAVIAALFMLLIGKTIHYFGLASLDHPMVLLGALSVGSACSVYIGCLFWPYVAATPILADIGIVGSILGGVAMPVVLAGAMLADMINLRKASGS